MAESVPDMGWGPSAPHTSAYLTDNIRSILKVHDATTVLDAGCGNGAMAGFLAACGFKVIGIDAAESGVAAARKSFPGLRFEVGTFESAPPGEFDAVYSTEVIEHLYAPHELVRYASKALKPGGVLIISTPYHGYFKNLALALLGKWDSHLTALWYGGHIKFWSRTTLTRLLAQEGFQVTGFKGAGRFPFLWKSMILTAKRLS